MPTIRFDTLTRVLFFILTLTLSGACAIQAAPPSLLTPGLIGYWRFDGSDGKTVKDLSGNGNDGVIQFGEIRREKNGASLELDGLGGHVRIDNKPVLALTGAVTTTFWMRPSELRHRTVLFGVPHPTEDWTTPGLGMSVADGRVYFGTWMNKGATKAVAEMPDQLPLNTWVFLAATYDGATVRLYHNGAQVAETPATGELPNFDQPLLIGMGLGSKPSFRGRVGELRLYNRALKADEIKALFDQTKTGYDLTPPVVTSSRDGTVLVETHGSSPESNRPWRAQKTRLLELLDGYKPSGASVKRDRFGGRADRVAGKATGFFTVTEKDGRRWLVDPEGHPFYHIAINAVREPKNVETNFGSADRWAETVTAQLRENGFNGLGNWQTQRITKVSSPLVWVLRKDFLFAFARQKKLTEPAAGTQGFLHRAMPVFHPEFEAFCDEYGKDLANTANDPNLLGIMTDNEIQCPTDMLDRFLALDASNPDLRPQREAAEAWLAARRKNGVSREINQHDRYEFIAYAFERYYRIVTKAVRKYDKNHLYLGSRINYHAGQFDNPWFWKMLRPYHDVVSVNYYNFWGPDREQFANWEEWSGKPILLTEWYAKAMDVPGLANTHGAGWLVKTQEDRARYYQHFVLNSLEIPSIVGFHFFKYLDDPTESKALDSAGGTNKGMFTIEGKPYAPLLERARAINWEVYPLIDFFDARNK